MVEKNEAELYVLDSKWKKKLLNSIVDIWSFFGKFSILSPFFKSPFSQNAIPPFLESGIKRVSILPNQVLSSRNLNRKQWNTN